ncbi:MAG: 2-C-methyl-D-erythritol 2,4-cyclodiphosphate synthase [Pseudomonadales bacterium]
MRIGHGFDVHAFGEGEFVTLGGTKIPHTAGLIAHSDGDVLLHALCDALLGAAGLGDIGHHFPDTDPAYKGIDSLELLMHTNELLGQQGYSLINADMTIVAQQPRVSAYKELMRANISRALECAPELVNIKATTTEKLGYLGREEGIAAHAVVLIGQS